MHVLFNMLYVLFVGNLLATLDSSIIQLYVKKCLKQNEFWRWTT